MTETMHGIQPVMVPAAARTSQARLVGILAVPATDQQSTTITGLPDQDARTTRDRVYAAIRNSAGCVWPQQPITLSVESHGLSAGDSGLDLAFAVALLAASGQIPADRLPGTLWIGELGLDGTLRPASQLAVRLAAVAHAGLPDTIIAPGNLAEAALATRGQVSTARTLAELVAALRGEVPLLTPQAWPTAPPWPGADLADLPAGPSAARRILEVAAAGGHHLLLTGPPQGGAGMLAERLPGLLPDLDPGTAAEVAVAHRAAGILPPEAIVRHRPPWQAVHHTISRPALTGTLHRPGAVGLAHGGLLFCDDAGELSSFARDALCTVLDQQRVTLLGAGTRVSHPARLQLVVSAHGRRARVRMARLFDRVDIHAVLPPLPQVAAGQPVGEPTAVVAARVVAARAAASARWAGQPWATNAEATAEELQAALAPVSGGRFAPLRDLVRAGALTPRGSVHVLRLALTVADLAGRHRPSADDVAEAIRLRTGQEA
jgi:magnesium chelatase family protein